MFVAIALLLAIPARADDAPPPEIQAIFDKIRRNETLTQDETAKAIDWQANHIRPAPPTFRHPRPAAPPEARRFDPDNAFPTIDPRGDVSKRPRLDAGGYARLVAKILDNDKLLLGGERAAKIAELAGKQPLSTAAVLALAGDGAGALYAVALAASHAPADPVVAADLGAALQPANQYAASWDVLVYADSLAKDDATIQSNLAYAAMYLGDANRAARAFRRAIELDASRSEPHLGLALLAKVQGDTRGALVEIRAAVARGSSSVAGLLADDIAIQTEPLAGNNDPVVAARAPIGDDPGFKLGGGIVIEMHPRHHSFPIWTPPTDAMQVASFAATLGVWTGAHRDDDQKLHAQYVAARDAANAAIPRYLQSHTDGVTIPRIDTRVVNVLDDYAVIYRARVRLALKAFADARKVAIPDAMAQAMPAKCEKRGVLARQLTASLGSAYAESARQLRFTIDDYLIKTDPYIDSVWQPDLQRALQLQRDELVKSAAWGLRSGVTEWTGTVAMIICNGRDATPEAIAKNDPTADPTVAEPTPAKCRIPSGHIGMGVVSVDYSCDGFVIKGGEGLFGGIDVQFKGPSGHMEQKLFLGVGAEAAGDRVSGEGKAVIFITKAGGQVVDFGAEYGVSGKLKVAGQSVEGTYDLSATWRNGPNLSASGKATLFGTEHPLWKL